MYRTLLIPALFVTNILLISCDDTPTASEPDNGTAEVIVTTSGTQISDNGYTLFIDESSEEEVPVSGRGDGDRFEDILNLTLSPGSHEIQLTGTAPNCSVESENPVSVSVTAGESTTVDFSVRCAAALNNKVVFVSDRDGPTDLYVADPGETPSEGFSNYKKLTNDDYPESHPAVSSDGTKIAYVQSGNIWVINADGTGAAQLTNSRLDREPTWFAGNTKIAFSSNRDEISQLYVMNADGSNETRLATEQAMRRPVDQTTPLIYQGLRKTTNQDDEDKASPKLMTVMGGGDDSEIVILDLDDDGDGITDTVPLTNNNHFDGYPALSPDGSELLIVVEDEKGTKNFRLIDAENGETISTSGIEPGIIDDQAYPAWSPDGSEIIFTSVNQVRAKPSSAAMAQDYNSSRSNKPSSSIEIDTDKTDFNVKHVVWSPAW